MRLIFGLLFTFSILIACSDSPQAQPLKPVEPVFIQGSGPDYSITLKDWVASPVPHAPNRIVYREHGYRFARMLTMTEKSPADKFNQTVRTALSKESVTNVKFIKVKDVGGEIAKAFRREADLPDATFKVWIVSGKSDAKNIKGAGFSIITAEESGPETSLEVFLAETDEYEHMGGIMVPLARLFKVGLTNPDADLLSTGRAPDDEAIDAMATQFEQFMFNFVRGQILKGMAQQQTLSIMQGLDQANDYGLQDSTYDWGK